MWGCVCVGMCLSHVCVQLCDCVGICVVGLFVCWYVCEWVDFSGYVSVGVCVCISLCGCGYVRAII